MFIGVSLPGLIRDLSPQDLQAYLRSVKVHKELSLAVSDTYLSLALLEGLSRLWKDIIVATFRKEARSLDLARAKATFTMECFGAHLMERLEASGGIERQELFQQLQRACKNPDAVFYSVMRLGGSFSAQGMRNTNWKRECKDIWKLMQDACREVEMALPGPDEVLSLVAQCDSDINSDISSDIKKVRDHVLPYFGLDGVRAAALYHVGDLVTINGSQRPTLWRICALSGDVGSDSWQADLSSQDYRNIDAKPGMDQGATWEIEPGVFATVVAVDKQSNSCSVSLRTCVSEHLLCHVETPLPGPPQSPVFGLGQEVSLVTDPTKSHRIIRVSQHALRHNWILTMCR